MEKIILLYSDLEGTILNESSRTFEDIEMYNFLKQLSRLQELECILYHQLVKTK